MLSYVYLYLTFFSVVWCMVYVIERLDWLIKNPIKEDAMTATFWSIIWTIALACLHATFLFIMRL